ncbi:MAG: DUF3800 domain-containing protein [Pseudomonadota bacterium]
MPTKYALYVDESGEAGIGKVRSSKQTGASPYMALGGVLVPQGLENTLKTQLDEIARKFGKAHLHCNKLSHAQKVFYSRQIAKQKVLLFGVISLKETLGWYKDEIGGDSSKYYNKCAQYLLEKVGRFMSTHGVESSDISIFFEEANFNYGAMRRLISKCRETPIRRETRFLRRIEPYAIAAAPKSEKPMLQLADLSAHALYQCANKSNLNYEIPEPRYLRELQSRFFSEADTRKVVGYGIKAVHRLSEVKLDRDIQTLLTDLKGAEIKKA